MTDDDGYARIAAQFSLLQGEVLSERARAEKAEARVKVLEDELALANALTVYCDHCHSAPGEYCSDDEHKRCPAHAERVVAGSDAS